MTIDWRETAPELEKKLDPKHVKKPNGKFGPKGDYIEGWHAIAEANEVFGFGGWSYAIDLTQVALQEVDKNGKTQWQAAYTCVCTVTVGDVIRQDVGFGSGFAAQIGDAVEGATKEAATDALKRALRTFGNRFGLALYDKDREGVGSNEPAPDWPAMRDRIKGRIERARTLPDLREAWTTEADNLRAIKDGAPPMYAELNAAKDDRRSRLVGPDTARQAPEDHLVS